MKFLIVGLGNIGHEYNNTRHNIGFDVVNYLAQKHGGTWRTARYADVAEIKVKGKLIILVKPSTYMNLSGNAVRYWMQEEKIPVNHTLIITDDLALPFGKLRMRPKGSDGGHNGLKHIQAILGNDQYPRLRFGVGSEFAKGKQMAQETKYRRDLLLWRHAEAVEGLPDSTRELTERGRRQARKAANLLKAKMVAVQGYIHGMAGTRGILLCARQFMNSLEDSSLEECKRAIEEEPFLAAYYEIGDKYIKSRDGRIQFAFAGLDRNIASIKSKGRILLCWVDEAEPVTDEAWQVLIPTLREEDSELWVTWNPKRKNSATDKRFRGSSDPRTKVIELNWRDNPAFPTKLERDRLRDKEERPEQYDHIWEGGYATVLEGAYFAKDLNHARAQGRIGKLAADPLLRTKLF